MYYLFSVWVLARKCRGLSDMHRLPKLGIRVWYHVAQSLAWNSSDCFESFSPLRSTTEGVITTRSNRMKFRVLNPQNGHEQEEIGGEFRIDSRRKFPQVLIINTCGNFQWKTFYLLYLVCSYVCFVLFSQPAAASVWFNGFTSLYKSLMFIASLSITQYDWYHTYLTIIPRARMGSESIAHEAEGRMGYWLWGHEGERNNCFSKIQLQWNLY